MIEIKDITKAFNGRQILKGVSTTFDTGHVNLVIGGSGSGKTVLMKCMVGLVEIDTGEIKYDDKIFSNLDRKERKPFRQEIGMVFQGGALFDDASERDTFEGASGGSDRFEAGFGLPSIVDD